MSADKAIMLLNCTMPYTNTVVYNTAGYGRTHQCNGNLALPEATDQYPRVTRRNDEVFVHPGAC